MYMDFNNVNFNNFQTQVLPNTAAKSQSASLISQAPPDEFVPQSKPAQEETPQKKNSFVKKAALIGAAMAGITATAVFLYRKNKTTSVQKLAQNIEFKKAETLEEAVQYGKTTLGIKQYTGFEARDIDIINWINEGLTNVSNAMQGNLRMPKQVAYTELRGEALAGVVPYTHKNASKRGFFGVNKKIFSDIDAALERVIANCTEKTKVLIKLEDGGYKAGASCLETQNAAEMIKEIEAFKNGNLSGFYDKVALYNTLRQYNRLPALIAQSPFVRIKNLLAMLEQKGFRANIDLEDLKNKTTEEQLQVFNSLVARLKEKTGKELKYTVTKQGPFSTIYHEMGHLQDMVPRVHPTGKFDSPDKYPKELKKWLDDALDIQTANTVSPYAATGPGEFIAETFSRIIDRGKVSDDIMQLYNKLNGPKIPV